MLKKLLTKFHFYLGLFFLVDLWLFSLTGLFLNHPDWSVNEYRKESHWVETTESVTLAQSGDRFEKANYYLSELNLEGELSNVQEQENQFRFRVRRPRNEAQVTIHFDTGKVQLRKKSTDTYGVLNTLHIFNGMQRFDPGKEKLTWFATRLWVIAMDGLAVGLIVLVLTGCYMWSQTQKIVSGAVSLLLGLGTALVFLFL